MEREPEVQMRIAELKEETYRQVASAAKKSAETVQRVLDGEDVDAKVARTALDVMKATAPTVLRDKPEVAVAIGQVSMEQRALTEGDLNDALAHMFEARNGPGSVQRRLGERVPDA